MNEEHLTTDTLDTLPVSEAAASPGSRSRLYMLVAIMVLMATFAWGARSWAQFFLAPDEGNGVPVRLFTNTDYPAISIASRIIASGRGGQLYDLGVQRREQDALVSEGFLNLPQGQPLKYPYPYAPFIAVLWSPWSGLSPLIGMALWDLLNMAVLVGGLWYLLASLPLPGVARVLLLLAAITSFPWIVNLEQGQSSGIVMGVLATGIGLLRKENDLYGGLVLGLLALKTQWLLFFVFVLVWKLRWRSLLGMVITGLGLSVLAVLVMGTGWIPDFVKVVDMVQHWDPALLLDPSFSHSLSGGLFALLGHGTTSTIGTLMLVATVLGVVGLAFAWGWRWSPGSPEWDGAMALTFMAAIFTNLQVNTHDLVLLVLPGALGLSCLYRLAGSEQLRMVWYALLWASYLLPAYFLNLAFGLNTLLMAAMLAVMVAVLARREPALTT